MEHNDTIVLLKKPTLISKIFSKKQSSEGIFFCKEEIRILNKSVTEIIRMSDILAMIYDYDYKRLKIYHISNENNKKVKAWTSKFGYETYSINLSDWYLKDPELKKAEEISNVLIMTTAVTMKRRFLGGLTLAKIPNNKYDYKTQDLSDKVSWKEDKFIVRHLAKERLIGGHEYHEELEIPFKSINDMFLHTTRIEFDISVLEAHEVTFILENGQKEFIKFFGKDDFKFLDHCRIITSSFYKLAQQ